MDSDQVAATVARCSGSALIFPFGDATGLWAMKVWTCHLSGGFPVGTTEFSAVSINRGGPEKHSHRRPGMFAQ